MQKVTELVKGDFGFFVVCQLKIKDRFSGLTMVTFQELQ